MVALLIALALALPPDATRVTRSGSTTRLFDTSDSARACGDATRAEARAELEPPVTTAGAAARTAPTPKRAADEICDAGTLVRLAPLTRLRVIRSDDGYSLVRVVAGKNAGKQGWTETAQLATNASDAAAELEEQRQQADTSRAASEGEHEAATVRKIYTQTKEALLQACEAFDRSGKLHDILSQAPTDGARLDAYVKALGEQRNCLVLTSNGGDATAAETARRLLDIISPKVDR
jgi:hypothetical protein